MKPEELQKMLDKAEQMGYDRGVLSILLELLKTMDDGKMRFISYESIKRIWEALKK